MKQKQTYQKNKTILKNKAYKYKWSLEIGMELYVNALSSARATLHII